MKLKSVCMITNPHRFKPEEKPYLNQTMLDAGEKSVECLERFKKIVSQGALNMQFTRLFSIIIISMLLSTPVFAQIKSFTIPYEEFKDVQFFGYITVTVEGDAYKIGFFKSELTDYIKLLFKNKFAGIEYIDSAVKSAKEVGFLRFKVWTVGDNYPISYYVEGRMGSVDGETFFWDKFSESNDELYIYTFTQSPSRDFEISAVTGYGSRKDVPDTIRMALRDMVERFAIAFFKTRGAM